MFERLSEPPRDREIRWPAVSGLSGEPTVQRGRRRPDELRCSLKRGSGVIAAENALDPRAHMSTGRHSVNPFTRRKGHGDPWGRLSGEAAVLPRLDRSPQTDRPAGRLALRTTRHRDFPAEKPPPYPAGHLGESSLASARRVL